MAAAVHGDIFYSVSVPWADGSIYDKGYGVFGRFSALRYTDISDVYKNAGIFYGMAPYPDRRRLLSVFISVSEQRVSYGFAVHAVPSGLS